MPKTNLQDRKSYYERLLNEEKNSKHSGKYREICTALDELVTASNALKSNEAMTADEYNNILAKYKSVFVKCNSYFLSIADFNSFEKSRMSIVKEMQRVMARDIMVLEACDKNNPGSIDDAIKRSRIITVNYESSKVNKVGGNINKRIPIKTADGKTGFFTKHSYYNNDAEWANIIDEFVNTTGFNHPNALNVLERLATDVELQTEISYLCPFPKEIYSKSEMIRLYKMAALFGMVDADPEEEINDVPEDFVGSQVYEVVSDFSAAITWIANKTRIMVGTGIKKNSNLTMRNCAMSDIAALLGYDNLLAKSIPMTLAIDGKNVEGVFMETAEGSDIHNIQEDDLILEADKESLDSPEVFKQLADLQVLDYICGNTDRHGANMTYKFKKDENGKVVATGIQGIDNDCSFGSRRPDFDTDNNFMRMTEPGNMKYISEEMCAKIKSITRAELEQKLAVYKFSEAQIDAMCDRISKILGEIEKKDSRIQIMSNEDWKKLKLENIEEIKDSKKESYFSRYKDIAGLVEKGRYKTATAKNKRITYSDAQKYREVDVLMQNKGKIDRLKEIMNNSKARVYNTSEYNAMKKRFDKVEKISREHRENYLNKNLEIPANEVEKLKNAYIDLAEKTDKYIKLKSLVPSYERGQKRLEFAKELRDFAKDTLVQAELQKSIEEPEAEAEVEK